MIEEISFKNILSFKDETTLSFEATDDRSLEASHVVEMPNGTRLLRLAIVFGPNASGKSNLVYALEELHRFWSANPSSMDFSTGIEPFLLERDTPEEPSEFSLKIWIDDTRYWYQLILTGRTVILEKLSFYRTVQPTMVFERKMEDGQSVIKTNPAVQKLDQEALKMLSLNCLDEIYRKYDNDESVVIASSMPSIEYWFLLHYEKVNRFFGNSPKTIEALPKFIPNFDKKDQFIRQEKWVSSMIDGGRMNDAYNWAKHLGHTGVSYFDFWKALDAMI